MYKKIERQADSLNEALKRREATQEQHVHHEGEPLALDDSERVKVLSPGRLVAKRFFRNKLAIVGLAILIFMFVFTFLFPLFYPYSQTQIFYKYGTMNANYASATERTDFVSYAIGDAISVPSTVKNSMNSYINQMTADGLEELQVTDANGTMYTVTKLADTIYTLSADDLTGVAVYSGSSLVAEYDTIHGSFTYAVEEEMIVPDDLEEGDEPSENADAEAEDEGQAEAEAQQAAFEQAAVAAIDAGQESFTAGGASYSVKMVVKNRYEITRESAALIGIGSFVPDEGLAGEVEAAIASGVVNVSWDGENYRVVENDGQYYLCTIGEPTEALVASTLVFNSYDTSVQYTDEFKAEAMLAAGRGEDLEYEGQSYKVSFDGESGDILDASGSEVASLTTFVVRRYSGQDTLSIEFKTPRRTS